MKKIEEIVLQLLLSFFLTLERAQEVVCIDASEKTRHKKNGLTIESGELGFC